MGQLWRGRCINESTSTSALYRTGRCTANETCRPTSGRRVRKTCRPIRCGRHPPATSRCPRAVLWWWRHEPTRRLYRREQIWRNINFTYLFVANRCQYPYCIQLPGKMLRNIRPHLSHCSSHFSPRTCNSFDQKLKILLDDANHYLFSPAVTSSTQTGLAKDDADNTLSFDRFEIKESILEFIRTACEKCVQK